jgi:type IV secretion system protein TrbB
MAERDMLLSLAGPVLAGYLSDDATIEVMCNDNETCFVTRFGLGTSEAHHPGMAPLDRFLAAVAHEVGTEWSDSSPELSAALDDCGWRIEAGRPPVSSAIFLSLRKHPKQIFTLDDYEAQGILTRQERDILEQAMRTGERILIGGAVGSAKTSLVNALLYAIRDTDRRTLIIEDDPEIQCLIRNCVRRHVIKGKNTLRDLVQRSLRLNPSLLVIGEVRGSEALDMLKAGQTGHGLLTTLHVDEAAHVPQRLEQLVQEVSTTPQRELIGEVIDLIAHMAKRGTSWRCTGIVEVEGWDGSQYLMRRVV